MKEMEERVIILGWHFKNNIEFNVQGKNYTWTSDNIKTINNVDYIIGQFDKNPVEFEKSGNKYILYLFAHPKEEGEIKKIYEEIIEIIKNNPKKNILLFLHKKPWYQNKLNEYFDTNLDTQKIVICIRSGGSKPIYGEGGILSSTRNDFWYEDKDNKLINRDISKLPWEEFWDYLYINFKGKKNKIIKLWLPLAIDIQGLSEFYQKSKQVNDKEEWENKFKEYWTEIRKNWSDNFYNLLNEHSKIAEDYEELKLTPEMEVEKLKQFLIELNNSENNPPIKYLDKKGGFFFPNWLKKFIEKTNK